MEKIQKLSLEDFEQITGGANGVRTLSPDEQKLFNALSEKLRSANAAGDVETAGKVSEKLADFMNVLAKNGQGSNLSGI